MPRYFFDLHDDGAAQRDDEGVELPGLDAVRSQAMRALPAIAYEEIPDDGDRKSLVVVARSEDGTPVYTATLTFSGLHLTR